MPCPPGALWMLQWHPPQLESLWWPWVLRFYWWSAHADLDTSTTAPESPPVLHDQDTMLVLCAPDPRTLSDSIPNQVSRGISLATTASHGQNKENHWKTPASPLRSPGALATSAIRSPSYSWPKKTPAVHANWPQLMEMHRDSTFVPGRGTVPSNVQT